MKKLISIVIPFYNEVCVIDELVKQLKAIMKDNKNYDFEVIAVENGSWDSTFEKLKMIRKEDNRFKIVQLARNFGCDGGISAGLQYAKGHAAVLMNADLQDPPEIIPQFLQKWEDGNEIVYGIIKRRIGVPFIRRFLSSLFYTIINKLTSGLFPKNVSDFRLLDKKVYQTINKMQEKNRFLRGMTIWTGFKQTGIPFERPARFAGDSKSNFQSILKTALDGIFSFSYLPLKFMTIIGFILSFISCVGIIIFIVYFIIYGQVVPGYTSLMTVMLFMFGVLFLFLGIVGEYLSRIYDEVKQRPYFIIKNEIGFD
jgi:dolichol-phosphate mannosyltransferase